MIEAGQRFGLLTYVGQSNERARDGHAKGRFLCDCGSEVLKMVSRVKQGVTQSCGCLATALIGRTNLKHGMAGRRTRTREYRQWVGAKNRCFNPRNKSYDRYGGRGITMCHAWAESFEAFLADMGRCPPSLSLDRTNNDGNYEPGNCRWATAKEQANNRRPRKGRPKVSAGAEAVREWVRRMDERGAGQRVHQSTNIGAEAGEAWMSSSLVKKKHRRGEKR